MVKNIMIVGVGGQGALLASKTLGQVLLDAGYDVKVSEVHGMSQRGGDVQSNLRISSDPISSDLIPLGKADLIISLEPMEAMRYLPYLKKDGWIITNTAPFINIPNYPELQELLDSIKAIDHHVSLDVDAIAKEVASPRAANIVLLGAASPFLGIEVEKIEEGIRNVFGRKGEAIVEMNLKAFRAGLEVADKHINK